MTIYWGRHKGKSLIEICNEDPDFILWLPKNTDIKVPQYITAMAKQLKHERSFKP